MWAGCAGGVDARGGARETPHGGAGTMRDMVQNHLRQLFGLVAMELPAALEAVAPSAIGANGGAALHRYWFVWLVSFLEGGAVMAVEIAGAKLVAPFYGNSLYVWAAVLGLTLGGLAAGYALGGVVSRRRPTLDALCGIVLASALLVALMPWTAPRVMGAVLGRDLRIAISLSVLVFLFPCLVGFGMVSPMVIRLVARHADTIGQAAAVGRAAGTVYALSTLGGIAATYVVAFYSIHHLGLNETLWVTAALLAAPPLVFFARLASRPPRYPS